MNRKISGIYAITNQRTGRVYIGSSYDVRRRWYNHERELDLGVHKRDQLQKEWQAFGPESFAFALIEEAAPDVLGEREKHWIQHYATLPCGVYNVQQQAARSAFPGQRKRGRPMEDPWLTVDQISERLGFHPDTVRRLLREGAMSGHRINRRAGWRVRASEVDRFVEEGARESGSTDHLSSR